MGAGRKRLIRFWDCLCGFIEAGIVEALDQDEAEDQAESDEDPFQDPN